MAPRTKSPLYVPATVAERGAIMTSLETIALVAKGLQGVIVYGIKELKQFSIAQDFRHLEETSILMRYTQEEFDIAFEALKLDVKAGLYKR